MKEPFISIVIPTYNEEKDIKICLDSILSLEYKHKEIVVVDGASTDRTPEILRNYSKDGKIILIEEEKRTGISNARNKGAATAKGEIIIFLNADVIINDEFISRILKHYEEGADFVVCESKVLNDTKPLPAFIQAMHSVEFKNRNDLIWSEGFSCKKEAFINVGGFPHFPVDVGGEDAALGYELNKRYRRVLDRSIIVPHIAPEELRTFIRVIGIKGRGNFGYDKFYLKKSYLRIIFEKIFSRNIIPILLLLVICYISPLLLIPLLLIISMIFLYKAYLFSRVSDKYKKFFFKFFLLYILFYFGIKFYYIKALWKRKTKIGYINSRR